MPPKLFYLIDDDQDEQVVFEAALSDTGEDAVVVWRKDGRTAVAELASLSVAPDYIFIDINMPQLDSWECLRQIREIAVLANVPIAMYSTSIPSAERLQSTPGATLASAFFTKTSTISDLVSSLRAFILKHP